MTELLFMKIYEKIVKTKVVELDEAVICKPVAPSDLFSNASLKEGH